VDFLSSVLQEAFVPEVIVFAMVGVFLGVTVGAIPGLSGDMAIALLLPFVYKLNPVPALGMLIGIYKGSMFGGAISAISFGVPGTPAAVVTIEDGYPAKKNGYPKKAMLTALYSSVTGDFFSTLLLIFLALPLASVALEFGPVEFFALYVFALLMIALLVQGGIKKGLAAAGIGLFIGCIGMDPLIGTTRLIFGISKLRGGIPLIPLLVGVFAVSELMIQSSKEWYRSRLKKIKELPGLSKESGYDPSKDIMSFKIYLSTLKATLIGSVMGTFVGALPGAGSSLAAYVSYGAVKQFSSHPEQFGKGILEGVAAPEAGNSATCGASMIPLLAFGIPGSATAALIGAALIMQGINPGPLVFQENILIMFSFFVVILYASVMNLGFGYVLIPLYAKIAMVKPRFLFPSIFLFALIGTYASRNSVTDIWILLVAGLLGVFLKKGRFPLGPLVLAYIIGPGAEKTLRQALLIGGGEWSVLLKSPIAIGFYAISVVSIILLIRFQKN
jgi:putative tricarboxylic transport membrane protein